MRWLLLESLQIGVTMIGRKWSRELIVSRIQHWQARGVPIGEIGQTDWALCQAAYTYFGSWRDALEVAGFPSVRQRWSRERIIKEMRLGYPHGAPRSRVLDENPRLVAAATRYFGCWHDVLAAADLPRGKRRTCRRWTKQAIADALVARHERGLSLDTIQQDDVGLHVAAKRHFGSWPAALDAAGLPRPSPETWTGDRVIREIQSRHAQGHSLVSHADKALYRAAKRFFGGWRNALRVAGIDVEFPRSWTKDKVVAAIRQRHKQGLPLSRTWTEDRPLFRAAVRYFGNWEKGLRAAGFKPKARRKWSKPRVIAELRSWHAESKLSVAYRDHSLRGAAIRLFGSLDNALDAAGLEARCGKWTRAAVIAAIQDRYVQGQFIQRPATRDKSLATAAKKLFGSWEASVHAAGFVAKDAGVAPPRTWTREAVIAAIQDRHQQGLSLSNVWQTDSGLYCAAKKHFGGWRYGLIAAGFTPNVRQWSKRLIVREIQQRAAEGRSLSSACSDNRLLVAAAIRYCGSWRKALRAARINAEKATQTSTKAHSKE